MSTPQVIIPPVVLPRAGADPMERTRPLLFGRDDLRAALMAALALAAAAAALALALESPWWLLLLVPAAGIHAAARGVYRNPSRDVPAEPCLVVAPADGVVVDMTTVRDEPFMGGEALRIGIRVSLLDVHINRLPCSGTIGLQSRCPPEDHDGRLAVMVGIDVEEAGVPPGARVLVGQHARRWFPEIYCRTRTADCVTRGTIYGMIRCGSRVEVFLPAGRTGGCIPCIEVGARLVAGESVIARWEGGNGRESSDDR